MKKLILISFFLLIGILDTSAKKKKKGDKPVVVVLTFDDAVLSHFTVVAPILKKYGYDATFFVCEFPWKVPSDSLNYMKWNQIKELYKMGFEIGNHTHNHKSVAKMSPEMIRTEVGYIEDKCKEYGIPKPTSFAYPGNRADSIPQVVLKEMGYRFARVGGSKFYDPQSDKALLIPSYTMGSFKKLKDRAINALKLARPGDILVLTAHGVPDLAHPDYSTTPEDLITCLDYIKEHNFKVIAMRDLKRYVPKSKN